MRIRILESLERKARAAIKNRPEVRALEREMIAVEKGLAIGKYSIQVARELKGGLRLLRRSYVLKEVYRLMRQPKSA